jgi:alpha-tubulin suppressor-like RCC1 family protein
MNFEIDNQTKTNLELFGNEKNINSVFAFFNNTKTLGGRDRLYEMMKTPTNDVTFLISRVIAIAAGCYHSLALKNDGTVWSWGWNGWGQLGHGNLKDQTSPFPIVGLTGITSITGGGDHSMALKNDSTLWSWGRNTYGQLGDGSTVIRTTPIKASGLDGVISIFGGYDYSLALKNNNTVWAWGYNAYGQLGDGTLTAKNTPVQVSGLTGITNLSLGYYHSLALKNDSTVWAWGYNFYGQLGNGNTTDSSIPIQIGGHTGIATIAAGYHHSLAVKNDGTVWAWGYNNYGQLGDSTINNHSLPVQVTSLCPLISSVENFLHTKLKVFPNPTNGIISIEPFGTISHIEIINIFGERMVLHLEQDNSQSNSYRINLTDLPDGFYYLKIVKAREALITSMYLMAKKNRGEL